MRTLQINHLAVVACLVVLSVLGFLWFGPLFGDPWMEYNGLDMAGMEANPPSIATWITNFIATLIPVYVLAWLFVQMNVETLAKGALIGLVISFAFVHLSFMTGNMFAGRPYGLTWIDGGHTMVAMTIAGAILGAWRKYGVSNA